MGGIHTKLEVVTVPVSDVASLTDLLREAENAHGQYEPSAPKHHWSDWYAAYMVERQQGKTPEAAVKIATLHTEGLRGRS